MNGAVSHAEDVTCALMNLHLTSHYFTKLAPLMPKRYQALIDSFAGGDEEDGDDDDDDEARRTRLPPAAPIPFVCNLCPFACSPSWDRRPLRGGLRSIETPQWATVARVEATETREEASR